MEMTEYECKALKYVRDGKSLDAVPRGMTKAQFVTALKNLEIYGMVRLALVEGGDIEAVRLLASGQAALDDMEDCEMNICLFRSLFLSLLPAYSYLFVFIRTAENLGVKAWRTSLHLNFSAYLCSAIGEMQHRLDCNCRLVILG